MAERIFIDANIIIDLLNIDSLFNKTAASLVSRLLLNEDVMLCSPVTFAITYYFLNKQLSNKSVLNEKAKRLFTPFTFTTENANIMKSVMKSSFTDLEDAIQYHSALEAGAEAIITKNYFDFYHSAVPVYHPAEYIQKFL